MRGKATLQALGRQFHQGMGKSFVVVFGAATCNKGRGYRPWPQKRLLSILREQTKLVLLDEHLTSQRCSSCAFQDLGHGESHTFTSNGPSHNRQTRACAKRMCRFHVSVERDLNSARSLLRLFMLMAHNDGIRPVAFQHQCVKSN